MKSKNELKKYVLFQVNEGEAVKEYLEDMALKGWKLKYVRTYFFFEKIKPQKIHYSVEVFTKASVFDTIPTASTNELINYCREAGWNFVCNFGQLNIFLSYSETPIPIETDENLKLKTIAKGVLKQNAITWFFLLPMILFNAAMMFQNFGFLVTSYIVLLAILLYALFSVVVLQQIIGFVVWEIKQKRRLKNGNPIKYISKKDLEIKVKIRMATLALIGVVLIFLAIYALLVHDYTTAIMMFFLVLLIPAIFIFSHYWQKGGFSRSLNIIVPVAIGLGIGTLIMPLILLSFILSNPNSNSNMNGDLISSSKTFLASSSDYNFNLSNGEQKSIAVFKSKYNFIIDQYLYFESHRSTRKDFKKINQPEWMAKAVFNSDHEIYVQYDNCVITLFAPESLDQSEIDEIRSYKNK